MNNFAEELTYWYLRFNGFFLLQNFVLHNLREGEQRGTADSDLRQLDFLMFMKKLVDKTKIGIKKNFLIGV
ncbi:hypothetical protein [Thermoanaerobacterium sp. RBIITD]|uniref:hypothetical protein n=1 Tax=Thermoanaerobacterium sp. RBIITD TaxID=1550240 RepID=UPI001E538280|nr:hypothetical protein [Thermoanaerobacterium sp. RBIITD]